MMLASLKAYSQGFVRVSLFKCRNKGPLQHFDRVRKNKTCASSSLSGVVQVVAQDLAANGEVPVVEGVLLGPALGSKLDAPQHQGVEEASECVAQRGAGKRREAWGMGWGSLLGPPSNQRLPSKKHAPKETGDGPCRKGGQGQ